MAEFGDEHHSSHIESFFTRDTYCPTSFATNGPGEVVH